MNCPDQFTRLRKRARSKRARILGCLVLWIGLVLGASAGMESAATLEYNVKAAFLVKFGQFVEWPESGATNSTSPPFTIGVLGKDPFGEQFDNAAKKETIKGRPVRVRRAKDMKELLDCEVIFICSSESARVPELLKALEGRPILTVSERADFASIGGMICFFKENGKVRFEINPATAERARLKLSAKLLQVARVTRPSVATRKESQ